MTIHDTAVHEAGHAVACLHFGVAPTEIVANAAGGHVRAVVERLDDRQRMLVGMAGAHAVKLLLERDGDMSREDCDLAEAGWRGLACRMHVRAARSVVSSQLDDLVWHYREQIEFLAGRLMRRGLIATADLAELVHRCGSPLTTFRKVIPKRTPAVMRPRPAGEKLPFAEWCRWIDADGMFQGIPG